ncbi:hypothetical protein TNCV_3843251 [Trichonephila clavipes]|nr:hypothetical protein TNCV_3843251 [Trichonephila clavipes]
MVWEYSPPSNASERTRPGRAQSSPRLRNPVEARNKLHPGVPPPTTEFNKGNVSPGIPKKGITSRLSGAGSLLPPVYSEAWAKDGKRMKRQERVENREGSLGYPGVEKSVFTKVNTLGKEKYHQGTSGLGHPYSPEEGQPPEVGEDVEGHNSDLSR